MLDAKALESSCLGARAATEDPGASGWTGARGGTGSCCPGGAASSRTIQARGGLTRWLAVAVLAMSATAGCSDAPAEPPPTTEPDVQTADGAGASPDGAPMADAASVGDGASAPDGGDAGADVASTPGDAATDDSSEPVTPGISCATDADCPSLVYQECQEVYCSEDHVCALRTVPDGSPCKAQNLCGSERYCEGGWCYFKAHHCEESCVDADCVRKRRCSPPAPDPAFCQPENPCMAGTLQGDTCVETQDLLGMEVLCDRAGHVWSVVPLADGQALLLGNIVVDHTPEAFVPSARPWIARRLPGGGFAWEYQFEAPGFNELYDAVELPGGDLFVVGVVVVDGWSNALAARMTGDGDVIWERTYGGHSITEIRSAELLEDGIVAVSGITDGQPVDPTRVLFARLDPDDGEILTWESILPEDGGTPEEEVSLFRTVSMFPFHDGFIVAAELFEPEWSGWYGHFSASGELRWSHVMKGIRVTAMAPAKFDRVVAAGIILHERDVPGGKALAKHAGIAIGTADGLEVTFVYKQPSATEELYFLREIEDGFLMGGAIFTATGSSPLLLRLDLGARVRWRTTTLFPQQPYAAFYDGAVLSDGTLLLGGGAGSAGMASANAPLMAQTDGWGNTTCQGSGSCFGRPQQDCVALDWCSFIGCTEETGCTADPQGNYGYRCEYVEGGSGCDDGCQP